MASIDDGQVALKLGEETFSLVPSIAAIKGIGRDLGGLVQALAKVQALDFDAMLAIAKHGLRADDKLAKRLPGLLFRSRIVTLIPPMTEYLMILSNGGKRPEKKPAEEADTEDGDDDAGDDDGDDAGNRDQAAGA